MAGKTALEVVRELLDLLDDGTADRYGTDTYLDLVAEECDWSERSTDQHFDGRRGTKADLKSGAEDSAVRLRDRHADVDEFFADGDRVAAFWTWTAVSADTGERVSATVMSRFTVRDGLIARWEDIITDDLLRTREGR